MRKDRNLEELLAFQADAAAFCAQVGELGRRLQSDAQEAGISLQDNVSRVSLHRLEDITNKLITMSGHWQQEFETAKAKTRNELEQWQTL